MRAFSGCSRTACSSAARAATSLSARCSITDSSNSGSTVSGLSSRASCTFWRAPSTSPLSRSASASCPAFADRCGPSTAQDATSASAIAATAPVTRAGSRRPWWTRQRSGRGSGCPAPQRAAARQEARGQQRRQRVARHEPREVDERVHAEDHDDREQGHERVPFGGERHAAVARPQPGRAQRGRQPGGEQRQRRGQPDDPEVGRDLHDVAVGVAHVDLVLAVARAHRRVATRADAAPEVVAERLQRLVPVPGADAAGRGEAAGVVRRRRRRRVGQRPPRVRDGAAEPAVGQRERRDDRDRREREQDEDDRAHLAPRLLGRRVLGDPEGHRQRQGEHDEEHDGERDAELVAGRLARRQRRRGRR